MIKVGEILVSDDIKSVEFVCHLEKCKGACCVEGDLGAPLEEDELQTMKDIQSKVKPYLTKEGQAAIKKQGPYILDEDGDYSTPTIAGRECAYSHYNKEGILKCGIEQAYLDGKIGFRKPISCHLYPIRITKKKITSPSTGFPGLPVKPGAAGESFFEAVNYHKWGICSAACSYGKSLKVPLYKFLREPLVRKYGQEWYDGLVQAIETPRT
ncbi:MAG TPA: DUF3109 family protein [Cyclobacteriaceae bacterium]|nr:DUF3109 family protein [Cyclobacteriaceae bacterium]